ncbi:hypothetical protein AAGS61_05860 [Lysinibacillus sp. KU-BSD001]|uniref:hypothetical protein n=1 Tax=Lysinibacillus sp. KU-BSD001 TaxID=3141328 RepID=UPI0036E16C80
MNYLKVFIYSAFIIILIMFLIPYFIVAWSTRFVGGIDASWLSFWGSFLGGILSAIGVIVTTYFIIKSNNQNVEKAAKVQDQRERERHYVIYMLNKNEEIITGLNDLNLKFAELLKCYIQLKKLYSSLGRLSAEDAMTWSFEAGKKNTNKYGKAMERIGDLKDMEHNLRLEIMYCFNNLKSKSLFFPEINQHLLKFEVILNNEKGEILAFIEEGEYEKSRMIFNKLKTDYESWLLEISDELVDNGKKIMYQLNVN